MSDLVRCSKCDGEVPAANQCAACGTFLPGNGAAVTHGLRRYQATGALPEDLKVTIEDLRAAVVAAQGGLQELDREPVRAELVRVFVDCAVGRRLLMQEVVKRGIDSKPGRAAYDRLLGTFDRTLRVAAALGLERRERVIDPIEGVRLAVQEASRR